MIDEASPLAGLDGPAMVAAGLHFFLMMRAEDVALATTVRDLGAYEPGQIHFRMRYADALSISDDGQPVLDIPTVPVAPTVGDRRHKLGRLRAAVSPPIYPRREVW